MLVEPRWFIGFDSLMELVGFAVALGIGFQAFKGYRLTKERTLLYLHFSFILLSAGLLVDALSTLLAVTRLGLRGAPLAGLGYTIYFIAQLLAYGLLSFAYIQQTKTLAAGALALAVLPLLEYHPVAELIILFLLIYITSQTAINYSVRKTSNTLLVFGGFLLITFSHLFFLLLPVSGLFFVFAHFSQLSGFLMLLAMLLRVTAGK